MTGTMTAQHQNTVTAGMTVTQGSGVEASVIVASLDGKVEAQLQASSAKTTTHSISVNIVIPAGKVTVAYAGTVKVTGKYKYYRCTHNTLRMVQAGTGRSWTVLTTGGAQCNVTPRTAMGKLAKKRYC
jgi:hypothetical protein